MKRMNPDGISCSVTMRLIIIQYLLYIIMYFHFECVSMRMLTLSIKHHFFEQPLCDFYCVLFSLLMLRACRL